MKTGRGNGGQRRVADINDRPPDEIRQPNVGQSSGQQPPDRCAIAARITRVPGCRPTVFDVRQSRVPPDQRRVPFLAFADRSASCRDGAVQARADCAGFDAAAAGAWLYQWTIGSPPHAGAGSGTWARYRRPTGTASAGRAMTLARNALTSTLHRWALQRGAGRAVGWSRAPARCVRTGRRCREPRSPRSCSCRPGRWMEQRRAADINRRPRWICAGGRPGSGLQGKFEKCPNGLRVLEVWPVLNRGTMSEACLKVPDLLWNPDEWTSPGRLSTNQRCAADHEKTSKATTQLCKSGRSSARPKSTF